MDKYIFIHGNPESTSGQNNVVAMVGTLNLLDYDVELASEIPAFKIYTFDDDPPSGSLNMNLVLDSTMQVDKVDTAKKFMDSFQKSFEAVFASSGSAVDFYPPSGTVIGTVST